MVIKSKAWVTVLSYTYGHTNLSIIVATRLKINLSKSYKENYSSLKCNYLTMLLTGVSFLFIKVYI